MAPLENRKTNEETSSSRKEKTVNVATLQSLMGPDGGIWFDGKLVKPGQYPVKQIGVHQKPDVDELTAAVILKCLGEDMFPGILTASIVEMNGDARAEGAALKFIKEGTLLVGIGGGPFDEHETPWRGEVVGHCAATLTAELLKVSDEPYLKRLLRYALVADKKPSTDPFSFCNLLKTMWQKHSDNPAKVISWAMDVLQAVLDLETDFDDARRHFERHASVQDVAVFGGRKVGLAVIQQVMTLEGEEPHELEEEMLQTVTQFARLKVGADAAVVIVRRKSGNVTILASKRHGVLLGEVFRKLVVEELELKKGARFPSERDRDKPVILYGHELPALGDRELPPEIRGIREWRRWDVEQNGRKIPMGVFNGSRTSSDTPPTQIPLERLVNLVKGGLLRRTRLTEISP